MKIRSNLALACCLLLALAGLALADEIQESHSIHLKLALDDGDLIDVEAEDLEVGESREFWSDSGKSVVLTRLAEGMQVEVDGETIDIGGGGQFVNTWVSDHEEGGERHVRVEKRIIAGHGDDEHGYAFIHADGDIETLDVEGMPGGVHWISGPSAEEHVSASGILDQLNRSTREELLEVLREFDSNRRHKVVKIRRDSDE